MTSQTATLHDACYSAKAVGPSPTIELTGVAFKLDNCQIVRGDVEYG